MRVPAGVPGLTLGLTLVLTGAVTSACSFDVAHSVRSTEITAGSTVPSTDAERALLTLGHLSDKFEVDPADDGSDDEGSDWGCLTPGDATGDDPGDVEISFSAKRDPGLPGVFNAVTADAPDEKTAATAFTRLADNFRECTHVHSTSDDGTTWDFDVTTDTDGWAKGGDQQINVVAIGRVGMAGMSGMKLPLDIRMSLVRVGKVATMVGFFDLSDNARATRAAHQRLIGAATARLRAVLAGDELPPTRPLLEDYEFSNILEQMIAPVDEA